MFGLAPQPKGIGDREHAPADGVCHRLFGLAPQPKGIGDGRCRVGLLGREHARLD